MGLRSLNLAMGMALIARVGWAQSDEVGVAGTPSREAELVAEEPRDIRVGDVIMAPAIEEPEVVEERAERAVAVEQRWTGLPILITDGLSYGLIGFAAADQGSAARVALPVGIVGYLLAGPFVHARRGNWGRAGLSLLGRAVLPTTGAMAAALLCNWGEEDCTDSLLGLTVAGMLAASVVDIGVIAREPVAKTQPTPTVQPALSVGKRLAFIGAVGTF